MDRLLFAAGHAAALAVLASTCYAAGLLILRRMDCGGGPEEVCAALTIGFGATGTILFLAGLAHLLYAPAIIVYVIVVHALAFRRMRPRISLAAIAPALVLFVYALAPPTQWDATMYHLPYAKAFAKAHAVVFVDTLRFPVFPQLNEMLFTGMLLVYDDVAAQLVQLFALAVTALLLYTWARRWCSARSGLLSIAFLLGSPIAIFLGTSAYVDAGLAMFFVAALLFWETWRETDAPQWLILSAAAAGFAAGTKYHGLVLVAALALATIVVKRRAAATFILIAALSGCAHYIRAWIWTGNPLFPFFTKIFGDNEWRGSLLETTLSGPFRLPAGNPLLWLLRLSYDRETLHGQPPYSPACFLLFPVMLWVLWRVPRLRVIGVIAIGYAALVARFDPRFLFPSCALLALCAGIGLDQLGRRWMARLTLPAAVLLLLPSLVWIAVQFRGRGLFPATASARDAYLATRVAGYAEVDLLNQKHGDRYTVYAIAMDPLHYFADGRMVGDRIGPYRHELVASKRGAEAVRAMRADYLLLRSGAMPEWFSDPAFRAHVRLLRDDGRVALYQLIR